MGDSGNGVRGRVDRRCCYLTVCHMYRVCARDVGKMGTVFVRIRTLAVFAQYSWYDGAIDGTVVWRTIPCVVSLRSRIMGVQRKCLQE